MINAASRAYLRASTQAVPNGLMKPAAIAAQGKRIVVDSKPEKNAPCGNTRAVTALQSDYRDSIEWQAKKCKVFWCEIDKDMTI